MFGAIAGGIASALAGGAMSKLFGGGQKAASGGIQGDVLATDNNTVGMGDRSEERFSRNAETDLVCRLLLEKKKKKKKIHTYIYYKNMHIRVKRNKGRHDISVIFNSYTK